MAKSKSIQKFKEIKFLQIKARSFYFIEFFDFDIEFVFE